MRTASQARAGNSRRRGRAPVRGGAGFTILEILIAVAIFGMVVTAIHASWSAILRSARVGRDAAAELQRGRIASRTLEDALVASVMFTASAPLYPFLADTSGDFGALSFVSRLPPSFPGSGYFGDQVVRRVQFTIEADPEGGRQLVLRQSPLLQTNMFNDEDHTIVLARDVQAFLLEFCQQRGTGYEWVNEWRLTNQLPKQVRFALAFGKPTDASGKPRTVTTRTVSLPSVAVPRDSQVGAGGPRGPLNPGQPGQPGQPGVPGPDGINAPPQPLPGVGPRGGR